LRAPDDARAASTSDRIALVDVLPSADCIASAD
jgi:hypothetical protein